jgi:hypothetical protein
MKKALRGCARLFLVAGVCEISKFEMLRDLAKVVDFLANAE